MDRRRIAFNLGVTYQTKPEQLNNIPQLVKEIILKNELVEFDRGHLKSFADSSLNFEFVYYILSPDYSIYMDIQQKINFDIYEGFNRRGIEFAYPTQTLFVNKEN